MSICAVICGADAWTEVELWGKAKYDWLKTFSVLEYGIPSHDTFVRVFARIDPEEFRRSHDNSSGKEAIHMVSVPGLKRIDYGYYKLNSFNLGSFSYFLDILTIL